MGLYERPVLYVGEPRGRLRRLAAVLLPLLLGLAWVLTTRPQLLAHHPLTHSPRSSAPGITTAAYAVAQFEAARMHCATTRARVGPPPGFAQRKVSDRYDGARTAPRTRIANATLWTGGEDGREVLDRADVVLDRGLIVEVAASDADILASRARGAEQDERLQDAAGAWVTPGIIDVHVHMGVDALPTLPSLDDTNSRLQPVMPFLRSADGFNQHDLSFKRTAAGGITTALMLPGSALNVGGQAFTIKPRQTKNHFPSERILEPPSTYVLPGAHGSAAANATFPSPAGDEDVNLEQWLQDTGLARPDGSVGYRHLKAACGENARRVFSPYNRLDEAWGFRKWLERARKTKQSQDAFCAASDAFASAHPGTAPSEATDRSFPEDLEIEALVAVLRGQVKVNTHCYTTTDLDMFTRLTQEFKFPIAAFHHAHEAYLVPEVRTLLSSECGSILTFLRLLSFSSVLTASPLRWPCSQPTATTR